MLLRPGALGAKLNVVEFAGLVLVLGGGVAIVNVDSA